MDFLGGFPYSVLLALAELKSHDPGRGVRLTEPTSAGLKRMVLGALCLVVAVLFFAAWRRLRRAQEQAARERRKLEQFLKSRNLSDSERSLLDDIVRASGEPSERVSKLVLSFDRGVDQYIGELGEISEEDRLQRLRKLKSLRAKLSLHRVAPGVPLLSTRELVPGQELFCRFSSNLRAKVFVGLLRDLDDSGILVEFPDLADTRGQLGDPQTQELDVYFLWRGDGGYRFRTQILSEGKPDLPGSQSVIWLLAHPGKLAREQRRNFLRIPIHESVPFAMVPAPQNGSSAASPALETIVLDRQGTIIDLSGGGFRLLTDGAPIRQEDLVALRLPFLEEPFREELLAARCMKVYRKSAELGFIFEDLGPEVGAALVRHVEAVHRQLRATVAVEA